MHITINSLSFLVIHVYMNTYSCRARCPFGSMKCNLRRLLYLHKFLQLPLDVLQTSDVVPGDVGHLHHGLTQGRWVALAQGPLKQDHQHSHTLHTVQHSAAKHEGTRVLKRVEKTFRMEKKAVWSTLLLQTLPLQGKGLIKMFCFSCLPLTSMLLLISNKGHSQTWPFYITFDA